MITIRLVGWDKFMKRLKDLEKKHIPYAIQQATNATAKQVQEDLKREIRSTFASPVPYTQRSPMISKWAERGVYTDRLVGDPVYYASVDPRRGGNAVVKIHDKETARGTPPSQYLRPQVFGGRRGPKRFERALQRANILPPGYVTVPGKNTARDGYGNIPGGVYGGMLLALGARERKRKGRRGQSDVTERTSRYFVGGQPGTRAASLPPGIYERAGRNATRVIAFVKDANYQPRFDFYGVARRSVEKHFERNFREAFAKALKASL